MLELYNDCYIIKDRLQATRNGTEEIDHGECVQTDVHEDRLEDREFPSSHGPRPLDSMLREEELQHLDAALQQLPADQRAIVALRELEGMTYAEIGEVLDIPVGTVTSRLVRGRERLAELLRRRLPDYFPEQEKT